MPPTGDEHDDSGPASERSPRHHIGFQPLAKKETPHSGRGGARMINVGTNCRRIGLFSLIEFYIKLLRILVLSPKFTVYQYAVTINYVFSRPGGGEVTIPISKSNKMDKEHEKDKNRCRSVYTKAMSSYVNLRNGGTLFYDGQGILWSLSELENENISLIITEGISKRPNFIRAEFKLNKILGSGELSSDDVWKSVHQCPGEADKSIHQAISTMIAEGPNSRSSVLELNNTTHYLMKGNNLPIHLEKFPEGEISSAVGVTKSIKTLEGFDGNPSLFMTNDIKVSLFHPNLCWPLIKVFSTFNGFHCRLSAENSVARRIFEHHKNCYVVLDYGEFKHLGVDGSVMKIKGFAASARNQEFQQDSGLMISVYDYFRSRHNIEIQYPDLFTVAAVSLNGERRVSYFPPEVLRLAPDQKVSKERMTKEEESRLIRMNALKPDQRMDIVDRIVEQVGLTNEVNPDVFRIEQPMIVPAVVLPAPHLNYSSNNSRHFVEPKKLTNWEIVFLNDETCWYVLHLSQKFYEKITSRDVGDILMNEMFECGMQVEPPSFSHIRNKDVHSIFTNAMRTGKQLLFFVLSKQTAYHEFIKACEQRYDILTQEINLEKARTLARQARTRRNIVNKTNMKLGGLNYNIGSNFLNEENILVLGFSLSHTAYGESEVVSVGYAGNILDRAHKFCGGFYYTERTKDIFGDVIYDVLKDSLKTARKNRAMKAEKVVIYFNGIAESQLATVNEVYTKKCLECFASLKASYNPELIVMAATKMHSTRLFDSFQKHFQGRVCNLKPGTIVDTAIVSPVYNEFYHVGANAIQGTTKPTKYTVIHSSKRVDMEYLEELTNSLCYDHQIIESSISLPVPLFIASDCSERGTADLKYCDE
ncbi:hypothetical protein CRE_21607 [Caenorhabditis remanei]|uniref:Piwi domain-containing protein n=1 Tax=Caenorhabditis remanei TaxID=31234 RepID=E3NMA0_CAERE|nr:hypothetical protein CRE_21607 [Caenorhabditis remanei]